MSVDQHEEVDYDLSKPRLAVGGNLKVAQKKGLHFYQTRSNAIALVNTLPAICIENSVYIYEDWRRMILQSIPSPRLPRKAVLTPNLHHGRQKLSNLEARTPTDHQSKRSEEYGETRCVEFEETRSGNIAFRIQCLLNSTVQEEDDVRRETVKKLFHQFETHPNRESLMADLNTTPQFFPFSKRVEGIDPPHGEHRVLRAVRDLVHDTMPRLFMVLGDRHCVSYVQQMPAVVGKK